MNSILSNKYLLLLFRFLIGFVFVFAAINKIAFPNDFALSIENYRIIPLFAVNIIAIYLPWLELIIGILLIFNVNVKENSFLSTALLSLFTLMVLQAVIRGLNIECGCFGTHDGQKVGLLKISENILLICISFILYKFGSRNTDD
ncbi:MAG: hypothetical protein D6830_07000 [Ignavibacteria bacterium]|nr:MAG: hypothetical protein D6830_07000 [Ignavibacteria bacterium]